MNRITNADFTAQMSRLQRALDAAKVTPPKGTTLHLEKGSSTYGRVYRLHWRDTTTGGLHTFGGDGTLGMTAREAYQGLRHVIAGVELVVEAQR